MLVAMAHAPDRHAGQHAFILMGGPSSCQSQHFSGLHDLVPASFLEVELEVEFCSFAAHAGSGEGTKMGGPLSNLNVVRQNDVNDVTLHH